MSDAISEEVTLLLMSIYGGIVLVLCYDAIRIFRRVVPASTLRVIVEDIIFWTLASIFLFDIFLKYNYGAPRYYAVVMTLTVMGLYEWLLGRHIVDKISEIIKKIMKTLLKPLKKMLKMLKLKNNSIKCKIGKKVRKCRHKKEARNPQAKEGKNVQISRKERKRKNAQRPRKDKKRKSAQISKEGRGQNSVQTQTEDQM